MSDPKKLPAVEQDLNEAEVLSNQTTFFEQELMEQTPPTMPVEIDPNQAENEIAIKRKKRVLIIGGTSTVTILLVLLAVVVLIIPEAQQRLLITPSPIPFSQAQTETPLSRRLDELELDLKASDPITLDVPFPPLNMTTLYLDPPSR